MFDKIKFAKILKYITDTYESQRDFSKKSGINRTYLSQYANMKLEEPPKPKILEKLANTSNGITTYDELMQVCGYTYITTLDSSSFGIYPEYWKMIFGDIEKINLTQNGSTFLTYLLDKIYTEIKKNNDEQFVMDFNPQLFIPQTNNLDEYTEYIKIFCFILCSFISTNVLHLNETEKKQLISNIQDLLQTVPILIEFDENSGSFKYTNIDTEGLDENDIAELNKFVEFLKNKKKQDENK